jgi:hypothetical protein
MPGEELWELEKRLVALDPEEDFKPQSEKLHALLTALRHASVSLSNQLSLQFFIHASQTTRVIA